MISMTGFAYREWTGEDISLAIEIKGYNNRFLELQVNLQPWLVCMEPKVRSLMGSICGRGKVEVWIRVKEINAPLDVTVNTHAARAYMEALSALAADLNIDTHISVSTLISMEGVLEAEKKRDEGRYWGVIEPVLKEAAGIFQEERVREGKHTEEDILDAIGKIESALQTVASHIPALENSINENIKTRFKELVGDGVIDDNRILAETAVLLMKYTISEEISRLSSHLAEFRSEAAKNERPGKKLDFLCQEINREINTIGSKSAILEVSRAVVDMKESLENIREQLRNVE
jgi:uncharacterized protein (TIGR00255 family)